MLSFKTYSQKTQIYKTFLIPLVQRKICVYIFFLPLTLIFSNKGNTKSPLVRIGFLKMNFRLLKQFLYHLNKI